MFVHVTKARYTRDYKVWLAFNDGMEGEIDLSSELHGEVFESLRDKAFFQSFALEGHTLSWRNGADFAPGVSTGAPCLTSRGSCESNIPSAGAPET